MERVSIYIDGGPFTDAVRGSGMSLDIRWREFLAEVAGTSATVTAHYFTSLLPASPYPVKHRNQASFIERLGANGIKAHVGRTEVVNSLFVERGVEVLLARQMLNDAYANTYDRAILLSNRIDLLPLLDSIDGLGRKINVSFFKYKLTARPQLGTHWKASEQLDPGVIYRNTESGRKPYYKLD